MSVFRVTTNTLVDRLSFDLSRLSGDQSRLTQQLSSGKKLIDASDDPGATGRVIAYASEKRRLQQFEQNSQLALSTIAVSTTTLTSLKKLANDASNIAPAASTTGDPGTRAGFAEKINGIIEQSLSLANQQGTGVYLFGARANTTPPFTATRDVNGNITAVAYSTAAGANTQGPGVEVAEGTILNPTTDGTQNGQIATLINDLVAMRDAITANDQAAMTTTQAAVLGGQDNIVAALGDLSTVEFRIEITRTQGRVRFDQLAELSSRESDADLAETALKFRNAERSYQAALSAGSKFLQQSLLDYLR